MANFSSLLGFFDHNISQVEGLARFDRKIFADRDALAAVTGCREVADPVEAPGISETKVMRPSASVPGMSQ